MTAKTKKRTKRSHRKLAATAKAHRARRSIAVSAAKVSAAVNEIASAFCENGVPFDSDHVDMLTSIADALSNGQTPPTSDEWPIVQPYMRTYGAKVVSAALRQMAENAQPIVGNDQSDAELDALFAQLDVDDADGDVDDDDSDSDEERPLAF